MNLKELKNLSSDLEKVYHEMSEIFFEFQNRSQLNCLKECSQCCHHPEIEATPFEMLPLAIQLLEQKNPLEIDQMISEIERHQGPCYFLKDKVNSTSKGCGIYEKRPMICRIFGAMGQKRKLGVELSVCKLIKIQSPKEYEMAKFEKDIPLAYDWRPQIRNLDPYQNDKFYPPSKALLIMLERILLTNSYEESSPIIESFPV